jgi:hypothetical protein
MDVQFVYRYLVLVHSRTITPRQHWAMLGVGGALLAGFMVSVYWAMFPDQHQPEQIQDALDSLFGTVKGVLNGSSGGSVLSISMIGRPVGQGLHRMEP